MTDGQNQSIAQDGRHEGLSPWSRDWQLDQQSSLHGDKPRSGANVIKATDLAASRRSTGTSPVVPLHCRSAHADFRLTRRGGQVGRLWIFRWTTRG